LHKTAVFQPLIHFGTILELNITKHANMKTIFIILLSFTIVLSSIAQNKRWTLNECMKYAVVNSPKVKRNKAQNSIYHQNYIEAIGKLLPQISASTNAYFNFGRGLDSGTNAYTDVNSFSNNYRIDGSMTLFDGLSSISKIKMEKINKLMGKQQLQQDEDIIAYETFEAYANVIYYKQMVRLSEEQLAESDRNVQQVERMEELGVKGFPDVAEMKAKQATDMYNLTKQRNLLTIGIILLKEKMTYPIDEELDIENLPVSDEYIDLNNELSALNIYNQAVNYLPKAQTSSYAVKAKEMAYRSSKGSLMPSISVDGGYSTNFSRFMNGSEYSSFKNQLKDKRGYYVGVTLSVPIFSGFSRTASVKRSKSNMIIAQTERDETLQKLYSEIEQVVADLKGYTAECYQAKAQVEATQVAHDVNQRKYAEGLISPLELHTSANRLLKAKSEELNARLMYQVKRKMLLYYEGVPFITE